MRKGAQALSPEAELGLVGELLFLGAVLDAGVPAQISMDSWVGPLDGVQDFELGTGAVEVKATLSPQGFPAKVGSLEQLDDSVRKPLFVAGARLSQRESGRNLPEIADSVREKLADDVAAVSLFPGLDHFGIEQKPYSHTLAASAVSTPPRLMCASLISRTLDIRRCCGCGTSGSVDIGQWVA